jgi:hypothetical protein
MEYYDRVEEDAYIQEEQGLLKQDKLFNFKTFEAFIEKHPEDVTKWSSFLKEYFTHRRDIIRREYEDPEEIIKQHAVNLETESIDPSIPHCKLCNQYFATTSDNPTITLFCNHRYHTACFFALQHEHDRPCVHPGCNLDMWYITRQLSKVTKKTSNDVAELLLTKYKENTAFKNKIKELKHLISNIKQEYNILQKYKKDGKKKILEDHAIPLHMIQKDINESYKSIARHGSYKIIKKRIIVYRRIEREIFNTYNLSVRDLIKHKLLKMNWNIRWYLERHRRFSNAYRYGIRIYPGSKKWVS